MSKTNGTKILKHGKNISNELENFAIYANFCSQSVAVIIMPSQAKAIKKSFRWAHPSKMAIQNTS